MKIDLMLEPVVSAETAWAQADYARGLGIKPPEPRSGRLAVVGGGHSAHAYIETLKRWNGEVWAINGAYEWCRKRGIDCRFFTADPQECVLDYAINAEKATLPPWAHPKIWNALHDRDLELVDFYPTFSASAPNVAAAAFEIGFREIVFFGVDCSFSETTHTYENKADPATMTVLAAGMEFLTTPAYYTQAQEIAALCREFPSAIKEMCGGLVRALVIDPDYSVTWMSEPVGTMFEVTF